MRTSTRVPAPRASFGVRTVHKIEYIKRALSKVRQNQKKDNRAKKTGSAAKEIIERGEVNLTSFFYSIRNGVG